MRTNAHAVAVNPLGFGRRQRVAAVAQAQPTASEDLRLFLWTFAAGFLSVSIFLA